MAWSRRPVLRIATLLAWVRGHLSWAWLPGRGPLTEKALGIRERDEGLLDKLDVGSPASLAQDVDLAGGAWPPGRDDEDSEKLDDGPLRA